MFPLRHDDDDPLEPEREAAGRHVAAEEHADEVVVAPAAAEAADPFDRNLHDGARVV